MLLRSSCVSRFHNTGTSSATRGSSVSRSRALRSAASSSSTSQLYLRRGGSGSLLAVLQARRATLQVHLERLRIELELARLWAQLAYLVPPSEPTAVRGTP